MRSSHPCMQRCFHIKSQASHQSLWWTSSSWWTHQWVCPWFDIQQGRISLPCNTVGFTMPLPICYSWQSSTQLHVSNAICQSECAICFDCISRCQGGLWDYKKECQKGFTVSRPENSSVLTGGHLQTPSLFSALLFIKSRTVNFNYISQTSLSISSIKRYTYLYWLHTRLSKGHIGWYLVEQLAKCLEEFDISEKVNLDICLCTRWLIAVSSVFGLALDNASNNDTMVKKLQTLLPGSICGPHTQICCICHIMNLAVKVFKYCL